MPMERSAPGPGCPPHYWLAERDPLGREQWVCRRCCQARGLDRGATPRRLTNACTWSRDEVALLDPSVYS